MRFTFPLLAVAAAFGLASANPVIESRQEAIRFGLVTIEPTSVALDEPFLVHYNSTRARWQPLTLDVYISGTYPNGFVTPYYQLLRTDYPANATSLSFETTLPVLDTVDINEGYVVNATYLIWAFISYPTGTGAIAVGGTSAGIHIELNE
ncbi:hypothetical protein BC835DRAFT_190380 [Cytidiella melzeri]|nr:hypothetical protein BC835DRAFT_190380 [Cytidiella melzeri]